MRSFIIYACISLAALSLPVAGGRAHAANIGSVPDLAGASTIADGTYVLNPDSYTVTAPIDISGSAIGGLAFGGTGLTVDAASAGSLAVTRLSLSGGTVNLTGGAGVMGVRATVQADVGGTAILEAVGGGTGSAGLWGRDVHIADSAQVTARASGTERDAHGVMSSRYTIQNGGVLNAHGGAGASYGVYARYGFTLNGGIANAHGGDAANSYGIYGYAYAITANGGALNAYAGTADGAHGARGNSVAIAGGATVNAYGHTLSNTSIRGAYGLYASTLNMTGGALNAFSGDSAGAYGAYFYTVNQSAGEVEATAATTSVGSNPDNRALDVINYNISGGRVVGQGGGTNSIGLVAGSKLTLSGSGVVEGRGGSGAGGYSYGVRAGSIAIAAGSTATLRGVGGAGGVNAFGVSTGVITQDGGAISGQGGSARNASGVSASTLNLGGDGQVDGTGGDGENAHGIAISTINHSGGGAITGQGGDGAGAYGVQSGAWNQSSGTAAARGGTGERAAGVRVNGTATLTGGDVVGTAGEDQEAHGFYANNINQLAGTIRAAGGSTAGASGVAAYYNYTIAAGATAIADGGVGGSYGVQARSLDVYGLLRLERTARDAASVYVSTKTGAVLHAGSTLAPTVHLTQNTNLDSGLLATVAEGTVRIEDGAMIRPWFVEHRAIRMNQEYVDYVFIDTGHLQGGAPGTIDGVFANPAGGLTIQYITRKNEQGQYLISFKRVMDVPEVIPLVPCENARRLMDTFPDLYDTGDEVAMRVVRDIDHALDLPELYALSSRIGRTLTPTAYAKLADTQRRTADLFHTNLFARLGTIAAAPALRPGAAYASLSAPASGWQSWADGLYQRSSRFKAKCIEFDDVKEKIHGLAVGVGRNFGSATAGASFGYARGSNRGGNTDIDVDNFAVTLGATLRRLAPSGGWFNPWASVGGGYVYGDVDQRIPSFSGSAWKKSSPDVHAWRFGVESGNDFRFGRLAITPVVGVDYMRLHQGGYREHDPAGSGLRVFSGKYDSLRPRAGLRLGLAVTRSLDLGVEGHIRYETMDRRARLTYSRLSHPAIVLPLVGEDRTRASGSLGATARYRVNERVDLSAEYGLLLEDGYAASRFSLGVGVIF